MPYHKSCKKRILTTKKSFIRNRQLKSRINKAKKNVLNAKNKETAEAYLKSAFSILDKAVKTSVIHRNKASNQKSNLCNVVKGL